MDEVRQSKNDSCKDYQLKLAPEYALYSALEDFGIELPEYDFETWHGIIDVFQQYSSSRIEMVQ